MTDQAATSEMDGAERALIEQRDQAATTGGQLYVEVLGLSEVNGKLRELVEMSVCPACHAKEPREMGMVTIGRTRYCIHPYHVRRREAETWV